MTRSLRTHIAAATMLLLPMGAVLAQPATGSPYNGPRQGAVVAQAQPEIRAMSLNSDAGLAPGATLRVQVTATPGADHAMVRLRGSGVQIALREQGLGNYVGRYTMRRGDRVDPGHMMVARLTWNDQVIAQNFNYPPAFQALAEGAARGDRREQRAGRDEQAPRISEVTPSNGARLGERGRTHISARFVDADSGVDPRSVRIRVDGLDVTNDARIQDDGINYIERLGRGRHTAELVVRDRAGNASRTTWSFSVV
ncbi:MAG: hypothetical protein JWP22_4091 [Ramlibacter sp.]|nr:hypothetical protein [Ramlibacter sp.]MDB5915416.1 hypothetical protein [Ramlibacter sp.]